MKTIRRLPPEGGITNDFLMSQKIVSVIGILVPFSIAVDRVSLPEG
jgi:hypothetical protein